MPLRYEHPVLASTQDEAIRLARAGAPDGTRVVALRQEDGRGRLSHRWASPEGGLYLSTIEHEPSFQPGLVPIAVGSRLAGALADSFGVHSVVKWPNDLLVRGGAGDFRKLGGIIVDRLSAPGIGNRLVIGLGINVRTARSSLPPEVRDRAAILAELVRDPPTLTAVETIAVGAVRASVDALETKEGFGQTLGECRSAIYGVGHRALLDGTAAGIIRELGEDGALWLERDGARVAVRAGDLTVLEER